MKYHKSAIAQECNGARVKKHKSAMAQQWSKDEKRGGFLCPVPTNKQQWHLLAGMFNHRIIKKTKYRCASISCTDHQTQ